MIILFIAPSVCALLVLLAACDEELARLGMQINENKSVCMRFGVELCADAAAPPPPPTECRRRAGAVFVTCSRHVVHQLYVAKFL